MLNLMMKFLNMEMNYNQYINPEGNIIVFEKKNDKFERIGGVILQVPKSYKLRGDRKSEDFFKYNKLEIKEEEIE